MLTIMMKEGGGESFLRPVKWCSIAQSNGVLFYNIKKPNKSRIAFGFRSKWIRSPVK